MRPTGPVVLVLAVALGVAACDAGDGPRSATYGGATGGGAADGGATARDAGCGSVERVAEQSGGHLIGDADPPQPYRTVPPTSGWHAAGAPRYGVHDEADPLREPEHVSVLESGGVVVSHRGLDAGPRAALEALAAEHDGVLAVTPYDRLDPGQVAVTAWGVIARCDGVDVEAVRAFVRAHAGGGPAH